MRSLFVAILVAGLSVPALAHANGLRCGNALVSEGDSKSEVLARCGEPAGKESRIVYDTVKVINAGAGDAVVQERTVQRTIDEWTYNFGPQRFIRYLVFEDGRLVSVRSGKYGYRDSKIAQD